jgi:hypothetical protein
MKKATTSVALLRQFLLLVMTPATAAAPITEAESDRYRRTDVGRCRLCIHWLAAVVAALPVIGRWRSVDSTSAQHRGSTTEGGNRNNGTNKTFHDNSFQDVATIGNSLPIAGIFTIDYSLHETDAFDATADGHPDQQAGAQEKSAKMPSMT